MQNFNQQKETQKYRQVLTDAHMLKRMEESFIKKVKYTAKFTKQFLVECLMFCRVF